MLSASDGLLRSARNDGRGQVGRQASRIHNEKIPFRRLRRPDPFLRSRLCAGRGPKIALAPYHGFRTRLCRGQTRYCDVKPRRRQREKHRSGSDGRKRASHDQRDSGPEKPRRRSQGHQDHQSDSRAGRHRGAGPQDQCPHQTPCDRLSRVQLLQVRIRDVDKAGAIASRVVVEGSANTYNGLSFSVSDQDAREDDLRGKAVGDAMRKAALYAHGASMKLGRVLAIETEPDRSIIANADMPMLRTASSGAKYFAHPGRAGRHPHRSQGFRGLGTRARMIIRC